jgi:hypothetical protein
MRETINPVLPSRAYFMLDFVFSFARVVTRRRASRVVTSLLRSSHDRVAPVSRAAGGDLVLTRDR